MRPRISIVLPVRDGARTLGSALESISNQTFKGWELVAVDDGSEDGTPGILEKARESDPRIRVFHQERLGIVEALNRGCLEAQGEFVARMDADDWMAPERLQGQLEFLETHPATGVVSCRVRHGGSASAQAGYAVHIAWINSLITPEEISLRRFVEAPVAHPSVMFRRELLTPEGGYRSGDFPEDYELWLRWMDRGVRFGKVDAELLTWNDPQDRLSRTAPCYRPEAFYRLKCHYLARWIRRSVDPARGLWLWGSGRITRQRFAALEEEGLPIRGFIDVDVKKQGRRRDGRPVVSPNRLPPAEQAFIVAGVAVRGARDYISGQLAMAGRVEGRDYLLAA